MERELRINIHFDAQAYVLVRDPTLVTGDGRCPQVPAHFSTTVEVLQVFLDASDLFRRKTDLEPIT